MPRTERKIDGLDKYDSLVADALVAYGMDAIYAVDMCKAASQIAWKRRIWVCRSELRAASAAAVAQCSTQSFTCTSTSPCGTGSLCKFTPAGSDLLLLDLPETPGKFTRPQPRPGHSSYDVEHAVHPLLALREGPRQLV